jgi:SAM-dependent methyltransferase
VGVKDDSQRHWDDKYRQLEASLPSWFQLEPTVSLELVRELGIPESTRVLDVGGGTSFFVDRLIERGFIDISVLDLSDLALEADRARVGPRRLVHWLHEDVLSWAPDRTFGLWHDRAFFHFLVEEKARRQYLSTLRSALREGGFVIVATFAEDGPEYCSGLPVSRYSVDGLAREFGERFTLETSRRELHTTPAGAVQPFTWVGGRISPH